MAIDRKNRSQEFVYSHLMMGAYHIKDKPLFVHDTVSPQWKVTHGHMDIT